MSSVNLQAAIYEFTEGVNPKVVSERLGHAKVATTLDIYSHVLPSMQEQAAQSLDRAFRTAMIVTK